MKNRICDLRKELGMTQEQLASLCKVTRQTIISLEGGRYNPSIALAHRIAVVFGLTIEQVFDFEGEL